MNAIVPPSSVGLSIEQAVLGSIMANNSAYERVGSFLLPEHFHDPVHAMLYRRMAERIGQGRFVDALILKADLENDRMLEEAGGTPYLAQLLASMVSINSAGEYGIAIREAWTRREMAELFLEGSKACARSDSPQASQIAAEAMARLSELAEPTGARPSLSQAAETLLAEAEAAHQRKAGFERLDVGLPSVDRLLGGLWPGNLYYIMARSGTGKTSAAMQFCRHIARNLSGAQHVHVFSLEMPTTDILRISVAAESKWTARQIRAGEIGTPDDWLLFQEITKTVGNLPIVIDDAPADIAALKLRARQVCRTKKIRLIVIDHLAMIGRDPAHVRMPENLWMPALGYELKNLAKELNVPVVALCQVNKTADGKDGGRPSKNDLPHDSGQAADEIHAIHRRELTMASESPQMAHLHSLQARAIAASEWEVERRAARNFAEWIALKVRFGTLGSKPLRFNGPRQTFEEIDHGISPEEQSYLDMMDR